MVHTLTGNHSGHRPAPAGGIVNPDWSIGMFERDHLLVGDRQRELRRAADEAHDHHLRHRSRANALRRAIGTALVALGTTLAGARDAITVDEAPCGDAGMGARA